MGRRQKIQIGEIRMEWWVFEAVDADRIAVEQFEKVCDFCYPDSFKKIVKQYDGGSPEYMEFDTKEQEGRVFNNLLSFDADITSSMWYFAEKHSDGSIEWVIDGLDWRYIPFARDPFGNYICFDRTNNHVVFWDHEIAEVEEVADTFTEFINSLYESED